MKKIIHCIKQNEEIMQSEKILLTDIIGDPSNCTEFKTIDDIQYTYFREINRIPRDFSCFKYIRLTYKKNIYNNLKEEDLIMSLKNILLISSPFDIHLNEYVIWKDFVNSLEYKFGKYMESRSSVNFDSYSDSELLDISQ